MIFLPLSPFQLHSLIGLGRSLSYNRLCATGHSRLHPGQLDIWQEYVSDNGILQGCIDWCVRVHADSLVG